MYYADEVREPEEVPTLPKLREAEVDMARTLVENLSERVGARAATTTATATSCSS